MVWLTRISLWGFWRNADFNRLAELIIVESCSLALLLLWYLNIGDFLKTGARPLCICNISLGSHYLAQITQITQIRSWCCYMRLGWLLLLVIINLVATRGVDLPFVDVIQMFAHWARHLLGFGFSLVDAPIKYPILLRLNVVVISLLVPDWGSS